MEGKMTCITDDLDYYASLYETYDNLSEKTGSIEEWVRTYFDDAVVGRLSEAFKSADAFQVLGVGSGAGNIDCAMLEQLLPSFPTINNTVVEPSVAMTDIFKQRVEDRCRGGLAGVRFDWIPQTCDEYLQRVEESATKFHLITAVHVLYYATDLEDTLRRLHDLLEDGGILFIIIGSREATSLALLRRINSIQKNIVPFHPVDEDVLSALDSLGVSYDSGLVPRFVKGNDIFDESSERGRHLLDFYTHIKEFRETAPEVIKDSVFKFLKEPDHSIKRGDDIFFQRHWVHVTVQKEETCVHPSE